MPAAVRVLLALSTALAVALPTAPAGAVVTTVGSDLQGAANTVEAHGADSVFWHRTVAGVGGAVPADGQVTLVRIKGSVVDDPVRPRNPNPLFHLQVLRPLGDGRVQVERTSAGFKLPIAPASAQPITSYVPVNLCVRKGDFVAFNEIGGHEWSWGGLDGMHVQAFNRAALGSETEFFSKNNGTNNGAVFAPDAAFEGGDEELLMQSRLATGPDATDMCLGGYRQHVFRGAAIEAQKQTLSTSKRATRVTVGCPNPTYGSCAGVLTLAGIADGKRVVLGSAPFKVPRGSSGRVTIVLSDARTKLVQHARQPVLATATATARDDPASDPRAALNRPPRQSARSSGLVTLKADEALAPPKDGDGDGMSNAWEKAHGLAPTRSDGGKDPDADGLSNLDEYRHGTDPNRRDTDGDRRSDAAEVSAGTDPLDGALPAPPRDSDRDGVPDARDNCPAAGNRGQVAHDRDGTGDACDADDDGDLVPDTIEPQRGTDPLLADTDHDNESDRSDNCPATANPQQADLDGDAAGDACDPDDDGDEAADGQDNCPSVANRDQTDTDSDGDGDACDGDDDDDQVPDELDNCVLVFNPGQEDGDADEVGDACDPVP